MLVIDARNGELSMIGWATSWLTLPLVAGSFTALAPVWVPPSHTAPAVSTVGRSSANCSVRLPCSLAAWRPAGGGTANRGEMRVPGAPTGVTATATDGQAEVNWISPRRDGSRQISNYVITSSPPSTAVVVAGRQTRALINDLPNGERFTFTVAAVDASGRGPASTPSNGVTPEALSKVTSTVSIRSVKLMFSGGPCVDHGTQCFGIQQNFFVHSATNGEYWVENLVFVEDTVGHGWEAEGNYEIWSGSQQSLLSCSGTIQTGPVGQYCKWPMAWHKLTFPSRLTLSSVVSDGDVDLGNSLDGAFPAWSPGSGGIAFIVDLHEVAVPSSLSLYAPETVIVGETGWHNATFISGSGSIASQMVLANGQAGGPDTQCVAQSSDTSTGEAGAGFEWSSASRGRTSLIDFAAEPGLPGDGDGVKMLPGTQLCA